MTWGWMEDNILSKWVGKYDEKNNITNSFRSIEPLINSQTGYSSEKMVILDDVITKENFNP